LEHSDRSTRLAAARFLFTRFAHDAHVRGVLEAKVRPDERFVMDGRETAAQASQMAINPH
jgi:hypothetical protein